MSGDDPLGRRSLFGPPAAGGARPAPGAERGRRAFFSEAPSKADPGPAPGPVAGSPAGPPAPTRRLAVLECGRCAAGTPLGLLGVVRALFPSLWVPLGPTGARRRHDRLTRCPACGRWAWCRLGSA